MKIFEIIFDVFEVNFFREFQGYYNRKKGNTANILRYLDT